MLFTLRNWNACSKYVAKAPGRAYKRELIIQAQVIRRIDPHPAPGLLDMDAL